MLLVSLFVTPNSDTFSLTLNDVGVTVLSNFMPHSSEDDKYNNPVNINKEFDVRKFQASYATHNQHSHHSNNFNLPLIHQHKFAYSTFSKF